MQKCKGDLYSENILNVLNIGGDITRPANDFISEISTISKYQIKDMRVTDRKYSGNIKLRVSY